MCNPKMLLFCKGGKAFEGGSEQVGGTKGGLCPGHHPD